MEQCFEPWIREKAQRQYRLLICDGHGSHCTSPFLKCAIENKIVIFVLISHSSHLTQPLDLSIFGPLKRVLAG